MVLSWKLKLLAGGGGNFDQKTGRTAPPPPAAGTWRPIGTLSRPSETNFRHNSSEREDEFL
eukprot:scaffold21621_cov93-Skeletonema_dohrnii-CCMP3373.AAC.1